ncbi:hypothetical protein P4S72_06960 [Vibrio sp. PP-XX7]
MPKHNVLSGKMRQIAFLGTPDNLVGKQEESLWRVHAGRRIFIIPPKLSLSNRKGERLVFVCDTSIANDSVLLVVSLLGVWIYQVITWRPITVCRGRCPDRGHSGRGASWVG